MPVAPVNRPKGMRKKTRGSLRAKSNLPAKAGHRKPPIVKGPHVTTPEDRALGRFLARLGLSTAELRKPKHQITKAG